MSRILIVGYCTVPGPDRAGVQLGHVLRALTAHHNVDVLCIRNRDQPYVERQGTARILRVPLHEEGEQAQVEAFRRAVKRQLVGAEYDVVHVRDGWSGIPVLESRDRLRYAVVYDAARSPMAEPRGSALDLAAALSRDEEALMLAADLVLAPHDPGRLHIAARGRADRVAMVPPGVDVDRFDWDELPDSGPPEILYVGALAPGRGVRILLRAMAEVVRIGDARLRIAGPAAPGFSEILGAAIRELGLIGRVELLGPVDHEQVPGLIAASTICVAPAAVELTPRPTGLFPTKLLEYMACRRAVVAPRRSTVTLLGKDGLHFQLFTPGDPIDLARKLIALLGDPVRRQILADAGYQLVRNHWTASGTRRALRAAYRKLAAQPAWRDRFATGPVADGVPVVADDGVTTELSDRDLLSEGTGAVTTIDRQPAQLGYEVSDDATRVDLDSGDGWVVEETGTRRAWVDDDGTPVDVRAVTTGLTPPVESRFVAGEVDIPTPSPELLDADGAFTAVSVLLGTGETEAVPEAGAADDGDDDDALTPTPTRARRPGVPPHLREDDRNR